MKVNTEQTIEVMNQNWTDIYYHLHMKHDDQLSHQAVRMLQHIEKPLCDHWPFSKIVGCLS